MTGVEIIQLLQVAVRLAADIGIDVAEFQASLVDGELPAEKRQEYIARARKAVEKL